MLIVTEDYETTKSHDLMIFVKCRWGWMKFENIQEWVKGLKKSSNCRQGGRMGPKFGHFVIA